MTNADCLSPQVLEQLALGTLAESRLADVQAHLESCSTCLTRLAQVALNDSVTTAMQAAPAAQQQLAATSESVQRFVRQFEEQHAWRLARPRTPGSATGSRVAGTGGEPSLLEPGRVLGNYVLEGVLGRGGMGVVYKARHRRMDRLVALKVVAPRQSSAAAAIARFQAEVQALARLKHPQIVTAHDADEADGVRFLVMELIDGSDLMTLVGDAGPLPVATAVGYALQAARGLAYAHDCGVIHRDIKPANLVLDADGVIKILDLGLAQLGEVEEIRADARASHETVNIGGVPNEVAPASPSPSRDTLLGTIDFMAPEQALGANRADARADIYGLGCTLFYLLTGQTVLAGNTVAEKLAALREQPQPAARSRRPDIPPALDAVLARMLSKQPSDRFPSMRDCIAALEPFAAGGGQNVVDRSAIKRWFAERTATFLSQRRWHTTTSRRAKAGLLIAVGVLLLAGLVAGLNGVGSRFSVARGGRAIPQDQEVPLPRATEKRLPPPSRDIDRWLSRLRQSTPPDDEVWRAFRAAEDPTDRTEMIHRLEPEGVPLERLVERLPVEPDDRARAALLLAIGQYDPAKLSDSAKFDLPRLLLNWYEHDPSPAVHSAIAWLARRWHRSVSRSGDQDTTNALTPQSLLPALAALSPTLEQKPIPRDGGWYQTLNGHTLVVLPGPVTFAMGSPAEEPDRVEGKPQQHETQHSVTIPHSFAIATTEITTRQFRDAHERFWERNKPQFPDDPQQELSWDEAAWYCNRLSELEGIPPIGHCYELETESTSSGKYREKANALGLPGYRMPTEAEWEFACRAGTVTPRYFGRDPAVAKHFAHWIETAAEKVRPVGMLEPNDFGLFDTLGNISEIVHDPVPVHGTVQRRLRGGSVFTQLSGLRAAARYFMPQTNRNRKVGLRIARTILPPRGTENRLAAIEFEPRVSPSMSKSSRESLATEFVPWHEGDVVCLGTSERGSVQPRRFRVVNLTDQPLTVSQTYLGGLFVLLDPPREIPPRGRSEFQIALDDKSVGIRHGDFVLRFTAGGESAAFFGDVTGNVRGSILHVFEGGISNRERRAPAFDFGSIPFQSQVSHTFGMHNRGDSELKFANITAPDGFTLAPDWQRSMAMLALGRFQIAVDTSQLGLRSGRVRIESSDAVEPSYEFEIRANVIDSEEFCVAGVFRDGFWLFDRNRDGQPDEQRIEFGRPGDRPLTGDVNGDGVCDLGVCRPGADGLWHWEFFLRGVDRQAADSSAISFGKSQATPFLADVTGAGIDRPAIVAPTDDGRSLLWQFDSDGDGLADEGQSVPFGRVNELPVIGDWNGDGRTDLGHVAAVEATSGGLRRWTLRTEPPFGSAATMLFGFDQDLPAVGDWDADGRTELGVVHLDPATKRLEWLLNTLERDSLSTMEFQFGQPGDQPIVLHGRRAK